MNNKMSSAASSRSARNPNLFFPSVLHLLLNDAEEKGFDDIISWVYENGNDAFQIHDKDRFEKEVSLIYFKTAQYKSFQRNLNLWGFRNIYGRKATYLHPRFIRGRPDLCLTLSRGRNKEKFPAGPADLPTMIMIRDNSDERLTLERRARAMESSRRSSVFNSSSISPLSSLQSSSLLGHAILDTKIGHNDDKEGSSSTQLQNNLSRQACFLMQHCILKNKVPTERSIIDEIIRTFCQEEVKIEDAEEEE